MSEKRLPPPDQPARDRIVADLDTNMLVEAGAGSGKTKSLVDRMLSLVDRGTPVEHMAAVTFTRKAAAELRERFQEELEKRQVLERDRGHTEAFTRYDRALRDLDGAFLGTIHAFCARLLREHPFEAGLDPAFQELTDPEFQQHLRTFWERLLERAVREEEPGFEALRAVAVDARDLFGAFRRLCEFPDVSFPVDEMALPDAAPCRRELRRLLKEAERLMPTQEPEPEWDKLQRLIRRLLFLQRVYDWDDLSHFMNVLDEVKAQGVVQKRWSDTSAGKAAAKVLERSGRRSSRRE